MLYLYCEFHSFTLGLDHSSEGALSQHTRGSVLPHYLPHLELIVPSLQRGDFRIIGVGGKGLLLGGVATAAVVVMVR